jgi:hypothetical protein
MEDLSSLIVELEEFSISMLSFLIWMVSFSRPIIFIPSLLKIIEF